MMKKRAMPTMMMPPTNHMKSMVCSFGSLVAWGWVVAGMPDYFNRSRLAAHSMCGVCGKRSTGWAAVRA